MFAKNLIILPIIFCFTTVMAQHDSGYHRIQYPPVLRNSHFGVSIGTFNYKFSAAQLEPGFTIGEVKTPGIGVRVNLFGHQFNKHLSANVHYMRPVNWVEYKSVNGDNKTHSVWMNLVGLTLQGNLPLYKKLSWYGDMGLGIIMRKGFKINDNWAVRNASFITGFFESGLKYAVSKKWALKTGLTYSPSQKKSRQPATSFYSAGFTYHMRPLSASKLEEKKKAGFYFPHQTVQLSYTTNNLGYGLNNFAYKESPIPFFWGGAAEVGSGATLLYTRNIFHGKKSFSFDWGLSTSYWRSRISGQSFFTVAVFPVLKFFFMRGKYIDSYFYYSVAGPAFISKKHIDGFNTGQHFTFQDLLGIGIHTGKTKKWSIEFRIGHFSNGNIFPDNEGVKIPLTSGIGYSF